jgi:hypothetical protein
MKDSMPADIQPARVGRKGVGGLFPAESVDEMPRGVMDAAAGGKFGQQTADSGPKEASPGGTSS